jgi:hypothetical protein
VKLKKLTHRGFQVYCPVRFGYNHKSTMNHQSKPGGVGRREFLRAVPALALGPAAARAAVRGGISCILVWQEGGASHLDTFDMKPGAPAEVRGPFREIATNVPGIRICEHLPRLARIADKLTIVRSMAGEDTNHERAANLLAGALPPATPGAPVDLTAESPSLRDRFGRTPLGEACLRARRLVHGGARMVRVSQPGWDAHRDHFRALRESVLPEFDRALAALVEDLHERRLLDRTLVIAAGEFGRSPRINREGGRDHHARAWSVCLAGAGLEGGRVLGATDRMGVEVVDSPVRPVDLVASVYTLLGIPPSNTCTGRAVAGLVV